MSVSQGTHRDGWYCDLKHGGDTWRTLEDAMRKAGVTAWYNPRQRSARILVTGSRTLEDYWLVSGALGTLVMPGDVVIHGGCPTGADFLAERWCIEHGIETEKHPADWKTYGKAAGPIRNQYMVEQNIDMCLAFPVGESSRGTKDCIKRAVKEQLPTYAFTRDDRGEYTVENKSAWGGQVRGYDLWDTGWVALMRRQLRDGTR